MGKTNKIKNSSKTVIASAVGVGILLTTPSLLSAETLKQNNLEVQHNTVKQEETKTNTPQTNVPKTEVKKEEVVKENKETGKTNQGIQNKTKNETDSLKTVEEKTKTELTKPKTITTPKPEVKTTTPNSTQVNEKQYIQYSNAGNDVWSKPWGLEGANYVSPTNAYSGQEVQLLQKMTVGNTLWYQFSINGKTIGWLDSKVLIKSTNMESINQDAIMGGGKNDGVWSLPYGLSGANYISNASVYAYDDLNLTNKTIVNGQTWYKFSANGKSIGWVHDKALDDSIVKPSNLTVTIGNSDWHALWTKPYGTPNTNFVGTTSKYAYQEVQVVKTVKSANTTWYQVKNNNGIIGWLDGDKALSNSKPADFMVTLGSSDWHSIWSNPYGTPNANFVGCTSKYAYQKVQVIKTMQIDKTNWYQIKNNNGIIGWVDGGKALSDAENLPVDSSTALVKGNLSTQHGVWSVPYGEAGSNWVASVKDYSLKPVKVIQKVKKNNVIWSKIQSGDRVIGWVDARTLTNHAINDENKTVMIGDVKGHAIWSLPYGMEDSKYVGSAEDFANKIIKIDKSMQEGSVLWYHINVGGKEIGWLDSKSISNASDIRERSGVYHVTTDDRRHGLFTRPYGMQNSNCTGLAVDNKYKNLELKMSMNYNGVTWFAFDNNRGGVFWTDSSAVSEGRTFPRMNVPAIAQRDFTNPDRDLVYGCEITAVTMMLQYAGANVDKVDMANEMPYHPYDPNQGFVGDPWGDGSVNTIYPSALTGLVRNYTGNAINLTSRDLDAIKDRLNNNHPVTAWMGAMHGFGIHAITLTGYDNDRVYYNDPWTGEKDASMDWWSFNNKWSSKGSKALSY